MFDRRTGFRAANGRLEIDLEQLIAKACEIAEEEHAFWEPGSPYRAITDGTDAGKNRVYEYLTYLWDDKVPSFGRGGDRFAPDKHSWNSVFVCFCVTKAFEALFGEAEDRRAFRKVVPLERALATWTYAKTAFKRRQTYTLRDRGSFARDTTGTYWAYDAGTLLARGDIVVHDMRERKRGQPLLTLGDLGSRGWAATRGDLVTRTTGNHAFLIAGDVNNSVQQLRYPLTAEGRIDRTDRTSRAHRAFAILRLKPRVEVVASTGASHPAFLHDVTKGVREWPGVPYRFDCASGEEVFFPSGVSLCVADDASLVRDERSDHFDAFGDRHNLDPRPLLEISGTRQLPLSENFRVGDFVKFPNDGYARIDPLLIERLQKVRDLLGRHIRITSGYRSWRYNKDLYRRMYEKRKLQGRAKKGDSPRPSRSPHTRGIAADIFVAGVSPTEVAKVCIDVFGCDLGLGIFVGDHGNTIHIDARSGWSIWDYGEKYEPVCAELEKYLHTRHGCG